MQQGLHQTQQPTGATPQVKIRDLRPSVLNNVNTTFIILEKFPPTRSDGGVLMCIALVADATASVNLQLWGSECDAFNPSDIVRLTNGIFSFHKQALHLRAGKKGILEKIGEFAMVFAEAPNMSLLQWVHDSSNPKLLVPLFPQPHLQAPGPPPTLNSFRGPH